MAAAARTVDWVPPPGSVIAAVGTGAAVVVALFGPDWRARRRKPLVAVEAATTQYELSPTGLRIGEERLTVSNEPGRDVATVEIRISAAEEQDDDGGGPLILDSMPLT